jgi:hypothetical protein
LSISIRAYPQYSYYAPTDNTATFLIDNSVSYFGGGYPFHNWTFEDHNSTRVPITYLHFQMRNALTSKLLVSNKTVPFNTTGIEIDVDLTDMREGSTLLSLLYVSPDGHQTLQTTSTIQILPERNDSGSMSRIDRHHGGLQVRSSLSNHTWKNIYPVSFYTSWDWISSTIINASAPKNLSTFRSLGFNIIHPVPPGGTDPFDPVLFDTFLTICDELELYIMYDMRHTYQNTTSITTQLSRLQSHPSLLLYYTADEPDGWCDPLNATSLAYTHIQKTDPYHPVSLVLNCANFHFAEYTAGADIILEDTYPIIKSSTYSPVYNTPCNASYGDCGCDNCHVNDPSLPAYVENPFLDISERVDNLYWYQDWLPAVLTPPGRLKKPVWGVPQAFFDADSFWSRWPSAREEAVMALLRVSHGAMGLVAWLYPTSEEVEGIMSLLAKVFTRDDVTELLLLGERTPLKMTGLEGEGRETVLDGAIWVRRDEVLILLLHVGSESLVGKSIHAQLPVQVRVQSGWEVLYGYEGWVYDGNSTSFKTEGLGPLDVSILKAKRKTE